MILDMERDSTMMDEGLAREVVNLVQKLRKKGQLVPTDPITVHYNITPSDSDLSATVASYKEYIETALRVPFRSESKDSHKSPTLIEEVCQVRVHCVV